tara:strand:+ start:343 stop:570 length:228 start_codon:yes stop_codon:yes gene_type:complete
MMGFGIESRPSLAVKSGSTGGGDVVIVVLQHFVDFHLFASTTETYQSASLPQCTAGANYRRRRRPGKIGKFLFFY